MEEIAEVYARALFEAAKEGDALDRVHDELGQFADALDDDRNLQVFLFSPYFSSDEKKDGMRRIVERRRRALRQLPRAARGAPPHAGAVSDPAHLRRPVGRGEQAAAGHRHERDELDERLVEEIGKRIEEQTGRRVELSSKVDPDVLGG